MKALITNEEDFDIIVVGSGASGLRAAISAKEAGAKVLLLSKLTPGLGTSTLMSHGVFACYKDPQEHIKRTLEVGHNRNNPKLVHILCKEAPLRIEELIERGLKASISPREVASKGRFPFLGIGIVKSLLDWAKDINLRILPWMNVIKILHKDREVTGVLTADYRGKFHIFPTRALILSTGGASALFKYHDNPETNLGDGYALVKELGLIPCDMEFIQFYPLMVEAGKISKIIIPPLFVEKGKILNEKGEEIREKYRLTHLRPIAIVGRDQLSQAIYRELEEGRKVFFDGREIEEKDLEETEKEKFSYLERRFGIKKRLLSVIPCAHFTIGGLPIREDASTTFPGLFAAGEATAGLHGANRMGGNALSETLVFGYRAGLSAASYILGRKKKRIEFDGSEIESFLDRIKEGKNRLFYALRLLREIMFESCGPVRRKKKLEEAIEKVQKLEEEGICCKKEKEIPNSLSLYFAFETAKMILYGALQNDLSVGSHYRVD